MLSLSDIQAIIRPNKNNMPVDDFRILNTWTEYKDQPNKKPDERTLDYLCYEIEAINPATKEKIHFFKAIKFIRIKRLPKSAKQSTSLMDIHAQLLSGVYSEQMNFITVVANLINPALGLLFLYGVQGVGSNMEEARQKARASFYGLTAMLTGSYRVLGFSELTALESEWLREKLFSMDYLTVIRGIPKASDAGEDGGNKGFGGKNVNPDSQGTLEELISGMSDYEYVLQILSSPVRLNTLSGWLTQTEREMTIWYDQLQGTKSLSFNISIPMMFMASNSATQGTSQAYTSADTVSYSQSESYNTSYGENVGQSLSESFGQSYGQSHGTSVTDSVSQSHSISQGTSIGQSYGESYGHSYGTSLGQSIGQSDSYNIGHSVGSSFGQSTGSSFGQSYGESLGQSSGTSFGHSAGSSTGQSFGESLGQSTSQNFGQSTGQSYGHSTGQSFGQSTGESYGQSTGQSFGQSTGQSYGQSTGQSYGQSTGESYGVSQGTSIGRSEGLSFGQSAGTSLGHTQGQTLGQSVGESIGNSHNVGNSLNITDSQSTSYSQGQSVSDTYSTSQSTSYNVGQNESSSTSHNIGNSQTIGWSDTEGYSRGHSDGYSDGVTHTNTDGITRGTTDTQSMSYSRGVNYGASASYSENRSGSVSGSLTHNYGEGSGTDFHAGGSFKSALSATGGGSWSWNNATGWGITGTASTGKSWGYGFNVSESMNQSSSYSHANSFSLSSSQSDAQSHTNNHSVSETQNASHAESNSFGTTESWGVGNSVGRSQSWGSNVGSSQSQGFTQNINSGWGQSLSHSQGINESYGQTQSMNMSQSLSNSASDSFTQNTSSSMSQSASDSFSQSTSNSASQSMSNSMSQSMSNSASQSFSNSASQSMSNSMSQSMSNSMSQSMSDSMSSSLSNSASQGYGTSASQSMSNSMSQSMSDSASQSMSNSASQNFGNSASQSMSNSMSQSVSDSQSIGHSTSQSISSTQSESQSYSQSATQSYSQSQSESYGLSQGKSVGQSDSQSYTESASKGASTNWGQSSSVGQGSSAGVSQGKSIGESLGLSRSIAQGMSASMGVSPSLGYNRSHQWLDQQVQDIIEMLQFQDDRIKKALRGNGAFYTYVYFACDSMDSLSAAKAIAKSTWQNEYAMTNPLQVLDLETEEQKHLLYHFSAFSADVTKINIGGAETYKYCTVLLPSEFVAYTHLPRISEGGIFAEVNDVPHFAVPSMLKGEIYMGTILSAERSTLNNEYRTPFDYRISEKELMHGFFTGASRSGKTVAAMRFIAELSKVRRSKTGKRLRIVCMDPKQDWRNLARYVEPERFKFYSLGNINFHPLKFNPCKIPRGVQPQLWIDGMIDVFCRAYGLLERGKQMMGETIYALYEEAGIFKIVTNDSNPGWEEEVAEKSSHVTFHNVYKKMEAIRDGHEQGIGGRMGNDTRDAFARLLDRLQCFNRTFSIEYQLFGTEEGMSVDELIGDDDVVVLESAGLESTFSNFIFGVITSGFYKEAKSHEGGFLNESQYETVLVIEEANKVFTGSDVAGTGSGKSFGMTGQSEFEEMLDQAAGLGLFVFAITQKIAEMPSSIIANSGLVFAGKLKRKEDVEVVIRTIAREERYEDRDLVKWFPRSPTGWFVCQSSRTFNFMDAEPILVQIARLNVKPPSNAEIEEILTNKMAVGALT